MKDLSDYQSYHKTSFTGCDYLRKQYSTASPHAEYYFDTHQTNKFDVDGHFDFVVAYQDAV